MASIPRPPTPKLPSLRPEILSELQSLVKGSDTAPGVSSGYGDLLNNIKSITNGQKFKTIMGSNLTRWEDFSNANVLSEYRKNYPYRFLILEATGRSDDQVSYRTKAEYRLPINPQDLTISTPFAINTTITSRGVLEEHNGIVLKQIMIQGSTGINIKRGSYKLEDKPTSFLGTVFAGTVSQVNQATASLNALLGQSPIDTASASELTTTGYFQYHMMRLFLESYAEMKKRPEGRGLRLAFEMFKDKQIYLVTPRQMVTKKSVTSPMEYQYSIQLDAWGTLPSTFGSKVSAKAMDIVKRDVSTTQRLFNALRQTRQVINKFKNIVSAARADVETNIYGPINTTILLAKDILSIPKTIADMPKNLRDSFQSSIAANATLLARENDKLADLLNMKQMKAIKNEQASSSSVSQQMPIKPDSLDNVDITDNINLSSMQPNDQQTKAISDATEAANNLTENDFRKLAQNLSELSNSLESTISSFDALEPEWDLLYSIQESISELRSFIADGTLTSSSNDQSAASGNASLSIKAFDFWEQSTSDANIAFQRPNGKFAVPFPFRSSLEELAAIYLGDATRWPEIAALNGLQHPYVDEDGFSYKLLSNGNGNQFNIGSHTNLYVGQTVYLYSDTQLSSKRKILKISEISPTNFLITVDKDPNLAAFTTADNAKIKAYLPYTINSMRQIFIPSATSAEQDDIDIKPITFLDEDPEFVKFSRIDLLLDSNGDLAIASDGFANLAFGKTNLVQAAKIKMLTVPGTNLLHPEFGAGVEVGIPTADINLNDEISKINESFQDDPRFNAPSAVTINTDGGTLSMNVIASVSQGDGILPITIPLSQ